MPYTEKTFNRFWNHAFMLKVKPSMKCVGLFNNQECTNNINPIGYLQQEFDHFKGTKIMAISDAVNNMDFEDLYNELMKTRVLCVAHHLSRKGNVTRDRKRNLIKPLINELRGDGIKLRIPIKDNEIHNANVEIINKWYNYFKNKETPEDTQRIGYSKGVKLTKALIKEGMALRVSGLGAYRIADILKITPSAVKRYIPIV